MCTHTLGMRGRKYKKKGTKLICVIKNKEKYIENMTKITYNIREH